MPAPQIPPPPGPDVPTQPHPLPHEPAQAPFAPPDLEQSRPGTAPENPALPHRVAPPTEPPVPTTPPIWD